MKVNLKIHKRNEWHIVFLFSILPFIDMLNGMLRNIPIGIMYKLFLCLVLVFHLLSKSMQMQKKAIIILCGTIVYTLFSITINIFVFHGTMITIDYPIKLIFNITLMLLLIENCRKQLITGNDLSTILDANGWIMIACYLIPYGLGVGKRVYSSNLGYKAFFIAQNELNLIMVVLTFYTAYALIQEFNMKNVIKLGLLVLCSMLLNTKTTIIASLIAAAIWFLSVFRKNSLKIKIQTLFLACVGMFVLKDRILKAIAGSVMRYTALQKKYYTNSTLTSILSGRDYFVKDAWQYLNDEHFAFRFLFGNGFCSETLTEMDIFDMFYYLGIFGAFASVVFLTWIFKQSIKKSKKDISKIRPISFIILCGLLFIAGHVLFMAMSGCFFVMYCCFLMYYEPINHVQKEQRVIQMRGFAHGKGNNKVLDMYRGNC